MTTLYLMTAGGFLDIWQRPITDTGQTGPDRGGGGKYLVVLPGSDIREMKGYIVARSTKVRLAPGETYTVRPGRANLVTNAAEASATFLVLQGIGEYDYVPLTGPDAKAK